MGIGTLRRYHWKDKVQAIADELKAHAMALEALKATNDLDKNSLATRLNEIERTLKNAGKLLEDKE